MITHAEHKEENAGSAIKLMVQYISVEGVKTQRVSRPKLIADKLIKELLPFRVPLTDLPD